MTAEQLTAIERHGRRLLAIFPNAAEKDPVKLCKKLRRLEVQAHRAAENLCNMPNYQAAFDGISARVLRNVNALLGNVHEYQPKTGAPCGCKRGAQRDNCPNCEGTGRVIDFAAVRNRKPLVPVFVNGDARGCALKIEAEYVSEHKLDIHKDWGGYGCIAPEINAEGE